LYVFIICVTYTFSTPAVAASMALILTETLAFGFFEGHD
jgi:hypothetical protein